MGMMLMQARTFAEDDFARVLDAHDIAYECEAIEFGTRFRCMRGKDAFGFSLVDASAHIDEAKRNGLPWIGYPDEPVAYLTIGIWNPIRNPFAPEVLNKLHDAEILIDGPFEIPSEIPNCPHCGRPQDNMFICLYCGKQIADQSMMA